MPTTVAHITADSITAVVEPDRYDGVVESFDGPTFVGTSKGTLAASGRRKGLKDLYMSDNWDHNWDRNTQRSWKNHRATQYKGAAR